MCLLHLRFIILYIIIICIYTSTPPRSLTILERGTRDPVRRRIEGVGRAALKVAVHYVLGAMLAQGCTPLLRAHPGEIDLPAARKGVAVGKGRGRRAIHIAGGCAPYAPYISLIRMTLYWFGRHGLFGLPENMASLSFPFSSSSPFLMYARRSRLLHQQTA